MGDVRALLLTDVVDSTKLLEELGDVAAAAVWAEHDRAARDLLHSWRGREIDKTDGMLLLFDAASDAAAYAMAYHRALGSFNPPLRARAGLHVGPVILRANTPQDVARGAKPLEVEGIAKAVAARVMSIAGGGQTLLSADARSAMGETALRLESQGHWRMKGIAEPLELFELGELNAPFAPPADAAKAYRVVLEGDTWQPARNIRHSLPAERDSFVGRRGTLDELARRLDEGARLVSVLGIGGAGKTRLVTRFGQSWLGDFPGGVWFCDLSHARNLDGIVQAVAQGLDVPLGRDDPVTQLGHAIAGRGPCLVILDNFEQVAHLAEETLGSWLNRASHAQFIVTTRQVLGLKGEVILGVGALEASDGAALFIRRAEAAKPEFHPDDDARSAIGQLVALLDCLPLAIELAAARVRVMPPRALLARISDRFKLLTSTGPRENRQATLRGVLDWSWDLLTLSEKAALAQLSVFEGGFTLESAEAVIDMEIHEDAPLAVDALQSLVQKSFVRQVSDVRFDLLLSVKEYAAENLRSEGRYAGSGPLALRAAEIRHGVYFADPDTQRVIADKGIELDNYVAACRRAIARGDANLAARALKGAWAGLRLRGPFGVAVHLASEVRAVSGLDPAKRAKVTLIAGRALQGLGKYPEAHAEFESALAMAIEVADQHDQGQALTALGFLDLYAGRMESSASRLAAAMGVASATKDRSLETDVRNVLGMLQYSLGQMDLAQTHYERGLTLAQELRDKRQAARTLANLGMLHGDVGSMDKARTAQEAALALARESGDRRLEGNVLSNLGLQYQVQRKFPKALDHLHAALAVARDLGEAHLEGLALCNLGMVYEGLVDLDKARDHYEAALAVARQLRDRRAEGQFLGYLGLLRARQSRFDDARACLDSGEALLREASDQLSLGVLLSSRAEAEILAGAFDVARQALAEAETIAAATGAGPASELGIALARARGLLRQ